MPRRADIADVNEADAKAKGFRDNGNQRALDMLQPGDVLVADFFGQDRRRHDGGRQPGHVYSRDTGNGFVVNGAIRDLDGIFPIDMSVYYKGVHPTPISRELMITGINVPIHIGEATVMPGDVVFGDREGRLFRPDAVREDRFWTMPTFCISTMSGRRRSSRITTANTSQAISTARPQGGAEEGIPGVSEEAAGGSAGQEAKEGQQ